MFTPLIHILVFLSCAFVLGIALGWVVWRLGAAKEAESTMKEMAFWRERLDQARIERDQDQDKITALEDEQKSLKKQIASLRG